MTNDELNYQIGWKKIEDFRSRMTSTVQSNLAGKAVWVHNSMICSTIKQDQSSIKKALKANKVPGSSKQLEYFTDCILRDECKFLLANPQDFLAMTDTPYGVYLSIISRT